MNNFLRHYGIDLRGLAPRCARQARVHFELLRTEPGYDFVTVYDGTGTSVQTFTGNHDDTWSSYAALSSSKTLTIQLETDPSIGDSGFVVNYVEWRGLTCP